MNPKSVLFPMLLSLGLCSLTGAAEFQSVTGEPQVYKQVAGISLKLFVTRPEGWKKDDQRPALVFFHGGGWVGGSVGQFNEHSQYFASRGLVCIQVEYRLLPNHTTVPPIVCIQDARSAMRWVRSHARELGIDPQRIASAGGSAGGHLAAHVGLAEGTDEPTDDLAVSPKANAMILFNPVLDNGPGESGAERVGDQYPALSPAHNVSSDDPPAVLFLGTNDKNIPVKTMENFRDRMTKAGVRCDLHLYEGEQHGFFNSKNQDGKYYVLTVRETDQFLQSLGWVHGEATLPAPMGPK